MDPGKKYFSTRNILFALIVLNILSLLLSEVQRRGLTERSVVVERQMTQYLDKQMEISHKREMQFLAWLDAKLDSTNNLLEPSTSEDRLKSLAASRNRDGVRAENVRLLRVALDQYRVAKGVYPGPFADNPIEDLAPQLVDTGLLPIPRDPTNPKWQFRYTTAGAAQLQQYGLKVTLENGGECLAGVGTEGMHWWGKIPPCPF